MANTPPPKLAAESQQVLLHTLQSRFQQHMPRHSTIQWAQVAAALQQQPQNLMALHQMESTGGEPDVVQATPNTGTIVFMDCAAETPAGRRSLCYDEAALHARKENKPAGSALGMAAAMGIGLLTEEDYRLLQSLGPVDTKTSSWLLTPDPVRQLGGALFGDYRYGQVFVYHNGAQSYYAARGFRGKLLLTP